MNDLTVVILSYNTKDITKICLRKAIASAKYATGKLNKKISILVVDNNSTDGSIEMIKKFPVRLLALSENVGVARGYNAGMKKSDSSYILLINNDTYLDKDTLFLALRYAYKNNCDVMTGRLLNGKGEREGFGGFIPTPFRTIRWAFGFESLPVPMKRIYIKDIHFFDQEQKLEWTPTCFMLLKKEVYEKTKGHDESMFFYMEDIEWCKRIKEAGFLLWYTPDMEILHLGGKSSRDKWGATKALQYQISGLLYFVKKHYPKNYFAVLCALFAGFRLRSIFYKLVNKKEFAYAYGKVQFKNV